MYWLRSARWLLAALCLALAPVAASQEPTEPQEAVEAPRFHAGMWCALRSERRPDAPQPAAEEPDGVAEEADQQEVAEEEVGCDAGVAAALIGKDFKQGRLSLVGALGTKTLGIGGAWTFGHVGGRPLSLALGFVAPYDADGIYTDRRAVVLGATVSLLRGQ